MSEDRDALGRKRCPVPTCLEVLADGYLFCAAHWRMLPRNRQKHLYWFSSQVTAGNPAAVAPYQHHLRSALERIAREQAALLKDRA